MFSRCPGLFIQPRITDTASGYPAAMFSPYADQAYPAAVIRWPGSVPSGAVWSKYRRCAMSALCACAAAASRVSGVTAGQPALARSWLTSARTCAAGSGRAPSRGEVPGGTGLADVGLADVGPLAVRPGDTGGVGGGTGATTGVAGSDAATTPAAATRVDAALPGRRKAVVAATRPSARTAITTISEPLVRRAWRKRLGWCTRLRVPVRTVVDGLGQPS